MADGVEALLCFDFGLTGPELFGTTSYILDEVVRPEFEKALGIKTDETWCLMALDKDLGKSVVKSGLSKLDAAKLQGQLIEEKGYGLHWVERE